MDNEQRTNMVTR